MYDDEQSEPMAQPEHDESILHCGMRLVEELNGIRIVENRSGFVKSDAMLTLIELCLCFVPFEA